MPIKNKKLRAEYHKKYNLLWYSKNKEKKLIQVRIGKKRRKEFSQSKIIDLLKASKCKDCSIKDIAVFEFDHVRGKKSYCIGDMLSGAFLWDTIEKEIKKCDIVCANCHRRRTFKRTKCYRNMITNY